MDPVRLKRKEDISKALTFMQSPLAYPDPEGYKDFLTVLVCNLLEEGKALFKDRDWQQAVKEFSEGLNVSQYAASEDICIPEALLESLFVNRAAAYYSMGEYDQGVEDCDKALSVCKESCQALYRKALCLKELGKYKEAYSCTTDCLLINRLDNQVNELAQELAVHLGLKIRKPYISAKEDSRIKVTNGKTTHESIKVCTDHMGNGAGPLAGITPGNFSSHDRTPPTVQGFFQLGVPSAPEMTDDCELIGEDLDSLLDSFPNEPEPTETLVQAFSAPGLAFPHEHTTPSVLPAPTPQLPPAFFSSASSQLNCLDSFIESGSMASTLDTLDDVSASSALDNPSKISYRTAAPNVGLTTMIQDSQGDLDSLDDLLTTNVVQEVSKAELDTKQSLAEAVAVSPGLSGLSGLYTVDGLLDALDMFPSADCASVGTGVDSLSDFILNGITDCPSAVSLKTESKERNKPSALSTTHEFKQACSACFPRKGKGIYTFVHKPDLVHSCEGDILLCRRINGPSEWTRVRSIPLWTSFTGPFVLCRELLKSGDLGLCKYGENCTFAFNQLEIDVWTEERRGRFNRKLLFENPAVKQDPVKEILRLLQEHKGMFIFLCGACYDNKPTMISNRSRDDNTICSNMDTRHSFDANKCLAFMIRSMTVRYRKVRPLHILCQLDLCRHNIRYGCLKKDECMFAHSDIELKTWRLQRETGITPDEIVKVSTNYYEKQEKDSSKQKNLRQPPAGGGGGKTKGGGPRESLNMRMKFVCAQCWRDGLTSEPDKALRYCSAKAKHVWTKDKRVLLVKSLERSKWVMVRPLPNAKKFPLHYDICCQILDKGRCNYSGNCTFAHSAEEKTMWTYMKNNGLVDMQQVYEMWLALSTQNRQNDESMFTQSIPEEKCIVMPTDYAEPMDGFHCRLCGKHSNSERQWQQHISTEKHKDRVFSCEEEDKALTWNYRFPAKCFELCPKLVGDCPDGMSCDYAHSPEELQEWIERRDLFRHKLAKAREDMLIMPDESDFEIEKEKLCSEVVEGGVAGGASTGGGSRGGGGSGGSGGVSASLTPAIWDKTIPYDGETFHLEYMDLDEFLLENGIPVNLEEEELQKTLSSVEGKSIPKATPATTTTATTTDETVPESEPTPTSTVTSEPEEPVTVTTLQPAKIEEEDEEEQEEENVDEQEIPQEAEVKEKKTESSTGDRNTPSPIDPEAIEVDINFQPDPTDLVLSSVPGGELFNPRKHRFSDEDLKPQPMIKKAKKVFVPDEQKDDKYWSRRKKNNVAAKRSRDARRLKENQITVRASFLERENAALRQQVAELRKDCGRCKNILARYEAKYGPL